jgi:hypothetical protein
MDKRQRILRGQFVKALLLDLVILPDGVTASTAQIYDPIDSSLLARLKQVFIRYHRAGATERYELRMKQALKELEKRELIRIRSFGPADRSTKELIELANIGYKIEIVLTPTGQQLAYRHALESLEVPILPRWDGKWRMIALDIPETKKSLRDTVRQLLKKLGFKMMQRSLWVIPYPCKGEVNVIKVAFGLQNMMWYLEATTIDREPELLQQFRLRR